MKKYLPLRSLEVFLGVALMSLAATCAFAQVDTTSSLTVQTALASGNVTSLGEPIVLHYTISNPTDKAVTYNVGPSNTEWYTLRLVDGLGRPSNALPNRPARTQGGLYNFPVVSIPPGTSCDGDIVVTRYLAPSHPGNYTLGVHLQFSPPAAWETPSSEPVVTRQTQDFAFPITVTAANSIRLKAIAEQLRQKALDVNSVGKSRLVLERLLSLPASEAKPSWEALINHPTTPSTVLSEMAEQLGISGSSAAPELLAQMLFNRPPGTGSNDTLVRASVDRALTEIYDTGNTQIRQTMTQAFINHGASAADLIEIVTASHPN